MRRMSSLREGMEIEVLRNKHTEFWCQAKVVSIETTPSQSQGKTRASTTLYFEKLNVTEGLENRKFRPLPPAESCTRDEYHPGDNVDAFMDNHWVRGIALGYLNETPRLVIYFPKIQKFDAFRAEDIRLSLHWNPSTSRTSSWFTFSPQKIPAMDRLMKEPPLLHNLKLSTQVDPAPRIANDHYQDPQPQPSCNNRNTGTHSIVADSEKRKSGSDNSERRKTGSENFVVAESPKGKKTAADSSLARSSKRKKEMISSVSKPAKKFQKVDGSGDEDPGGASHSKDRADARRQSSSESTSKHRDKDNIDYDVEEARHKHPAAIIARTLAWKWGRSTAANV